MPGCASCARRRERLLEAANVQAVPVQQLEAQIFCSACGTNHPESYYNKCPFRLQKEKQEALELRLKAKIEQDRQSGQFENRRGRQLYQQFPTDPPNFTPTSKKKW